MRQSNYSVGTKQKDIFAVAGSNFMNVNIKLTKTTVNSKLVNGILPAGTRIAKDGSIATEGSSSAASTAYGVLVNDVDFNNSKGTEMGSVCIFGFLSEARINEYTSGTVSEYEKAALNMIKFL